MHSVTDWSLGKQAPCHLDSPTYCKGYILGHNKMRNNKPFPPSPPYFLKINNEFARKSIFPLFWPRLYQVPVMFVCFLSTLFLRIHTSRKINCLLMSECFCYITTVTLLIREVTITPCVRRDTENKMDTILNHSDWCVTVSMGTLFFCILTSNFYFALSPSAPACIHANGWPWELLQYNSHPIQGVE